MHLLFHQCSDSQRPLVENAGLCPAPSPSYHLNLYRLIQCQCQTEPWRPAAEHTASGGRHRLVSRILRKVQDEGRFPASFPSAGESEDEELQRYFTDSSRLICSMEGQAMICRSSPLYSSCRNACSLWNTC